MTSIQEADSLGEKGRQEEEPDGKREKPGQSLQLEVPVQVVVVMRNLHGSSKINLIWMIIMYKRVLIMLMQRILK
ncbi:hypothetical protein FF1_026211 [Malus domestica]